MVKVGITGGIGSGKSFVCQVISAMGYPVYNADSEGKRLTNTHPAIIEGIKALFGEDVYVKNELDRKKVGQLVFSDKEKLDKLNSIIHPIVLNQFLDWVKINSNSELVFKETAILFESGANKLVDKTICIWAPDKIRIARVCQRDGVSKEEVEKRISNQFPQDKLIKLCDYVISNNNNMDMLVPQVVKVIDDLKLLR
jgi:dephospho-CoA kinase